MYRNSIILMCCLVFAGCSNAPIKPLDQQTTVCQNLSKKMMNNQSNMGQPSASSAQIQHSKLMNDFNNHNCY